MIKNNTHYTVTIDPKARPCPGVVRALGLAEDILRRGEPLFASGDLIHNKREIQRLTELGLQKLPPRALEKPSPASPWSQKHFLARTHGEPSQVMDAVQKMDMKIIDAMCTIVKHSHELIRKHVQEGWRIVIVGKKDHPEVLGLLNESRDKGLVISTQDEAGKADLENRSLILAQTTIDPRLFADIRKILSSRFQNLKIVDTSCRFVSNRQTDVQAFAAENDLLLVVGGKNSSNCQLLLQAAQAVNPRSYLVEKPEELDPKWLKDVTRVGITGGASTPNWQLEEMRSVFNNQSQEENPKGLKNRKGGKRLWWTLKNQNKKK